MPLPINTQKKGLLLKNGYRVDEIIFTDTLEEFNKMYIY